MYGISLKPEVRKLTEDERERFLSSTFEEPFLTLFENAKSRELVFGYITKARTKEFLDSKWVQHKTRKCIKVLFFIKKILGIKR